MSRIVVILCMLVSFQIGAQQTEKYTSKYALFYRGEDLFEKEQYASARYEFRSFINQFDDKNDPFYIKAMYYEGISALEIFNNDAIDLLMKFNANYPESIYKTKVFYKIGRYFYQKKDFKEALVWFNQLKGFDVDPEDKGEFYFKLGYANFQEKNLPAARSAFYEVKNGTSQYASPALYYYSHIAYEEKSYQIALEGFEKLVQDPKFKELVPYYVTQIYYIQGRYDDITKFAPSMVDSVKPANQTEMNHLIGDAFFKTGKYDEAVPFLAAYNKKANTTRKEDYQLGYAYFKSNDYKNAIAIFDRVSQTKDTLGQIAFYHVAECYLHQGNNAYARRAFDAASNLSFNKRIQEDALYNFAIISYKLDINPYDEAIEALNLYLKKYPDSDRKAEVYQYLVNVYTSIKNYESALKSLDALPNKDIQLKSAYQIVAFNYGIELYQKGEYQKSIDALKNVTRYNMNPETSAKAIFWQGDALFALRNYKAAIATYKDFIETSVLNGSALKADAYYNVGCAHVFQEEYPKAIDAFRNYIQQPGAKDTRKKTDAKLRLADCYFATKNDDQAIKYYSEVVEVKSDFQDQALYYLAASYKYKGNSTARIKQLQDLVNNYSKSRYLEQSISEIGFEYRFMEQDDKAMPYFKQIEKDYPNSLLMKDALLNIADIHYKKRDFAKSEQYYESILEKYGTDRDVCANAVKGIVNIYKAQKQLEKIDQLVGKYSCSDFTEDEQEDIYYHAGVEPYLDSAFADAIPDLEKYLSKFPTGKYNIEIKAYLANSLYRTNNVERSMEIYQAIFEIENSAFVEIAATRLSRHAYNNGDFENALIYYSKLEKVSSQSHIINNTRIGLMRTNFILEHWLEASEYAKKVLTMTQISNTAKLESEFVKGVSLYKIENFNEAKPALEFVVKNASNAFGPESKYYIADIYFKQQDFIKADAEIRALLKMKPAYDYWIAKGLILQTRVLIAKNDLFQAEHTLKSVIDNYSDQEDGILLEANQLWDELMQLKNKPKVIEDKTPTEIEINGK